MKKTSVTLVTMMMVTCGLTTMAAAQGKDTAVKAAKPGGVVVDVAKLTGTVKAVDLRNKTLTIEGSRGRTVVVSAKNALNLEQVKAGDKVNVEFVEEMALLVRKSDAAPSATETQMMNLAPKGHKPSGVVAQTLELTGDVESIDVQKRTIALKGPAGNVRTFKVGAETKNFGQIKKGDQVVLRFIEAMALSIVKP
ncbi:MAG TPA: hypothetical protein VFK65_02645 [Candidatus Binatia bacterium]|nr:hypothetical protein [Candidatus Binatia bacterium]